MHRCGGTLFTEASPRFHCIRLGQRYAQVCVCVGGGGGEAGY